MAVRHEDSKGKAWSLNDQDILTGAARAAVDEVPLDELMGSKAVLSKLKEQLESALPRAFEKSLRCLLYTSPSPRDA